jgi:hypothetical protein
MAKSKFDALSLEESPDNFEEDKFMINPPSSGRRFGGGFNSA